MTKYKKVLVTGAAGLVGSAIMNLSFRSPKIVGVKRSQYDLSNPAEVDDMLTWHKPDAIIHLAAKVGGVEANTAEPATFFKNNVTINTNVLDAARKHGIKRVICTLSTCVFPNKCCFPLRPEYLHLGPPHPSNYGFSYAKRMMAVQCQAYNEEYGTNFLTVIPCNIYGPNDYFNLKNAHVVPALIRKFWEAKLTNKPVTIWGSGSPLREFIYSADVARLLLDILEDYPTNTPLIISTGREHSIRDLVKTIAAATEFKGSIIYDSQKPDGQLRKPSDNTPLKSLFPSFKFTSLEKGIEKTVAWFADNYPNVRL